MSEKEEFDTDQAQRLLTAWRTLKAGNMKVAPHLEKQATEFMAAPLLMSGLVDTSGLSDGAISFGRMAGMGVRFLESRSEKPTPSLLPVREAQLELFQLFAQLFGALTGREARLVAGEEEIRERMMWRIAHEDSEMAPRVNAAAERLEAFYAANAHVAFEHAKTLGGMRLVTGGQRAFGPSALNAVRITGLYADTQLIPDPIHPFFTSDLHLNARHLQLANALFHILQLRPLVDARFPVPPVFVFPSFEQPLQDNDAHTMHGVEQLALRLLVPLFDGSVASLDDLFDYARKREDAFVQAVLTNRLFVPPGGDPNRALQPSEAVREYIAQLEGIRSDEALGMLKKLPVGVVILNGVLERLTPQYHLIENASELGAQPLLSQAVHWHYFEKCATANASDLRRRDVLSEQAFQTLRAVQDDSLSWLANIPVEGLCELIANNEHRWLREELNKYTSQLAGSGDVETSEMVREVSHGLASLVQRQQKAMNDIEKKYQPKKWAAYLGGGAGLAVAGAAMLPVLSPFLGVTIPIAGALAAIGGGALGFSKEKIGEQAEKRQAQRSMIGMLATARSK
ncbi:hypothetical protein [Comamonas testosteroni]|uniref:hypothetical protein n=1 Tax=Comamonas testosteroni TaxID=285 RepID=UPI0006B88A83|nr:hypothetical protein [Comamonas testosteroni]